jgi:hypothetical protein
MEKCYLISATREAMFKPLPPELVAIPATPSSIRFLSLEIVPRKRMDYRIHQEALFGWDAEIDKICNESAITKLEAIIQDIEIKLNSDSMDAPREMSELERRDLERATVTKEVYTEHLTPIVTQMIRGFDEDR